MSFKERVTGFHWRSAKRRFGVCGMRDYYTLLEQMAREGAEIPTSNKDAEQIRYSDPFAYCAAVGTLDTPDERYIGPKIPDAIVQGLIQQGIVSADTPRDFIENAVWRFMDCKVLVCHFGANLPCLEKADTGRVPTAGMEEFCQANPTADDIPAAITGRATVYQWACKDGKPEVIKTLFKPDERGVFV